MARPKAPDLALKQVVDPTGHEHRHLGIGSIGLVGVALVP